MFNHLLTVFVCAADCGSFNKAAEKLYLSAPSVMKQVNALEKQLDMKLFHRTNQGLHLTPRRSGDLPPCQIPFFLIPGMPSRKPVPLPAFLKKRFVSEVRFSIRANLLWICGTK